MARIIRDVKQNTPDDPEYLFECPGCGCMHWFKTTGNSPRWTFNGDVEKPTITPSIVADPNGDRRCHSFVTDGMIQFLSDCWHNLKGQTVPLPPCED